jgi:hypothetical protein
MNSIPKIYCSTYKTIKLTDIIYKKNKVTIVNHNYRKIVGIATILLVLISIIIIKIKN